MTFTRWTTGLLFAGMLMIGGTGMLLAQAPKDITLPGTKLYPESITSSRDGTLFVGSVERRNITRIAPGTATVKEWIKSGTDGMNQVFGLLADNRSHLLWVCSDRVRNVGGPAPALMTFDLTTGQPKASYPLPDEGAFCNDIAISVDGAAYISDTHEAAVYMLPAGSRKFVIVAKNLLLAGADGITFGDRRVLYVTGVTTGKLIRLDLDSNGKAAKVTELKLSKPVTRPDGMRTLSKNHLILAENGGNVDIVTFAGSNGDTAEIHTIREGVDGATAVTVIGKTIWAAEGKLRYWEDPRFIGQDPGTFKLIAIPLPKE